MKLARGEILERVTSGVILQQVNAQGVMQSGFAKALREKWPVIWTDYSKRIKSHTADEGLAYMGRVIWSQVTPDLRVASIVGQQFYGRKEGHRYTSYDALDVGLLKIAEVLQTQKEFVVVHFPTIGCGLGGGRWEVVSEIIEHRLQPMKQLLWRQDD